ncbi:MAG: hypothetical protein WC371_05140 [Parachlamydiales bacterium]|jgi:hypothetical protein
MVSSRVHFQRALRRFFLTLTALAVLAALLGAGYYWYQKLERGEKYQIKMIVQTGPQTEALKTMYLAELLGLSEDRPVSYFDFDEKKALQKLLQSPLVKKAAVKKIRPSFVYVDYTLKEPIAHLADYPNVAIDKKGSFFPLFPFFPPKNLPEIYLDIPELETLKEFPAEPFESPNLQLALKLLKTLEVLNLKVKRIDASAAFSKSFGKREVVLVLDEELVWKSDQTLRVLVFPRILRLSPEEMEKQLANYLELRKKMLLDYEKQLKNKSGLGAYVCFKPKVVDLRISKLAFID